jgi:hypothetical protein
LQCILPATGKKQHQSKDQIEQGRYSEHGPYGINTFRDY